MDLKNFNIEDYKPELLDLDLETGDGVSGFDLVQPKHDGWFVVLHIDNHIATVITSGGDIRSSFPVSALDAVIRCEWIYGTNWAQSSPDLGKFIAFDMMEYAHEDMRSLPYCERLDNLKRYTEKYSLNNSLSLIETFSSIDWKLIWKEYVEARNFEGLVFKNAMAPFGILKDARMKKVVTWNYVIIGFKEGTKRLEGTLGALVAGLYVGGKVIRIMDVGGGFSDVLRREIWDNQDQYLGMCFEARGKQHFDTGALRHPAFTKFRPDLKQSECTK